MVKTVKTVTTVYLVRHAQSEGNVAKFFQGHSDTSVTYTGFLQLRCLAERFKDIPLDKIYCSPLLRTRQTADAVNRYHGVEIIKKPELEEINGGDFEGLPWDVIGEKYPEKMNLWHNNLPEYSSPNGEKMQDVYDRMSKCVTEIAKENAGKSIAVVSHGCALKNFLAYVEFNDLKRIEETGWADNTAVSKLEFDGKNWKIIYKNDASHLTDDLRAAAKPLWVKN